LQTLNKSYYGFTPHQSGEITLGLERLADIEAEIRPLHEAHYNETETTYLDTPFSPSYDRYKASEEAGQFILFTTRLGVELVGYLQYYVFNDMHTQMKQAREDALFISPIYRGMRLAPKMLAYAENALYQLGCTMIGMTSKAPVGAPDLGPFLEAHGYRPVAVFFVKKLEG
jgi:GNAT superfamily N-acetyltransferase